MMDRLGIEPVRGLRLALAAFVISVALFAGTLGVALYLRSESLTETQQFAQELRVGLIKSCARNGNPLREAVQAMLHEQIAQSRNVALLHQLFPNFPPSELDRLILAENRKRRQTLREIEPVDCAALYPPP